MLKKNRKGQSTLEYIILVTAVIAVILGLVFTTTSPFRAGLCSTYNMMLNSTETMSDRLANTID